MRLIDSHAHLDFEHFRKDLDVVICRASEKSVKSIINIGADLERSRASIDIANKYKSIYATVGVHPDGVDDVNLETIYSDLVKLAKSSDKVVGVGECGLDYYFPESAPKIDASTENVDKDCSAVLDKIKEAQKKLFQIHIDVARDLELPLVIHIRNGENEDAAKDAYELLRQARYSNGVVHCFTLNSQWAQKFVGLGFKLGFTGIITYKNTDDIRSAVEAVDVSDILVETDCPFLAPQKYRGKRNEPSYVVEVLSKILEIKGVSSEVASETIYQNTIDLFKLNEVV